MKTFLITIAIIAGILLMLFVFWCIIRQYKYKNFQKTMKPGDACFFYLYDTDRINGKIENIHAYTVLISYKAADGVSNMIRVKKEDIYPVN